MPGPVRAAWHAPAAEAVPYLWTISALLALLPWMDTMADPTVVVDNLHVVYRVYGAGGNKGTAATSLMRLVRRQRRVSI